MKLRPKSLFFSLLVLFAFQNCSQNFGKPAPADPENLSLGNGDLEAAPLPVPDVFDFRRGETLTGAALGGALSSELHSLLAGYFSSTGIKAIAVARNGLGSLRIKPGATQAEVDRMAVESCNVISGESCVLIVSGMMFVVDSSQLQSHLQMRISSVRGPLQVADVPMISEGDRSVIQNYLGSSSASRPYKVLVLAPSGEIRFGFGATQAEANRQGLQSCELEAELPPCLVFAEGSEKVFHLGTWNRAQRLRLAPAAFTPEDVPFIPDSHREALKGYFTAIEQGFVGSLAIGRSGSFASSEAPLPETTETQALEKCRVHDSTCFLYSTAKKVMLRWDQLTSQSLPRAAVCSIPRGSCFAHSERGCGPGYRWIANSGSVEYRVCR